MTFHRTVLTLALATAACSEGDPAVPDPVLDEELARSMAVEVHQDILVDVAFAPTVDLSDETTIGERIEDSLDSIDAFWSSQSDCIDVSLQVDGILVDFGSLDDNCTFRGRTFAGLDLIDIDVDAEETAMLHTFTAFTDGTRVLDGDVDVSWSDDDQRYLRANYVVADLEETTLVEVDTDHRLKPLDPNQSIGGYGFVLDGDRVRTEGDVSTTLRFDAVEMKVDRVAPSGGGVVWTSADGTVTRMDFEELSDTLTRTRVQQDGDTVAYTFLVEGSGEITLDDVIEE